MGKKNKIKKQRSLARKIFNGFLGLFGFLVFFFILFLVYSQTASFHNYLRNKIVSYYSENFNGSLNIGDIRGSLFTSLEIDSVSIKENERTFFSGKTLSVKLDPLLILSRTLRIRKIVAEDVQLNILEFQKGEWNINSLSKNFSVEKDSVIRTDSSSESSPFPFKIAIETLQVSNFNFLLQNFNHLNSDSVYDVFNEGDVRLQNINLNATVFVDVNEPRVNLILNDFNFEPNLKNFRLKHLGGFFYVDSQKVLADNVRLETDSSKIDLTLKFEDLNLFKPIDYLSFKNKPVSLKLDANPFCFDDLSSFLSSTEFLKGKPNVSLRADGPYGNLNIKKLKLKLGSTEINAFGKIKKLERPKDLFLDLTFENSNINESDAFRLMPTLGIPNYNEFTLKNTTIKFNGKPTNFRVNLKANTDGGGKIKISGKMNFDYSQMKYDLNYFARNLNIEKIIDVKTNLNFNGKIKGTGVDPTKLKALLSVAFSKSKFNDYSIDTLNLISNAKNKIINLNLLTNINNAKSEIEGILDFREANVPRYNLTGYIDSLNLSEFTEDKSLASKLNFSFVANGKSLNIDDMVAGLTVELRKSLLKGRTLQKSKITLALRKDEKRRQIELKSDLLDLNLEGNFLLNRAIDLLAYQGKAIAKMFENKFGSVNPSSVLDKRKFVFNYEPYDTIAAKPLEFSYNFSVKKFEPIAVLLNAEEFDIAGEGSGKVRNDSSNFSISGNFRVKNFFNTDKHSLYYFSGVDLDLHFSRNNLSNKFDALFGSLNLNGKKVFLGEEFRNISTDVVFNQSKLMFDASASVGKNLAFDSEGQIEMLPGRENLSLSFLNLKYKGDEWQNASDILISASSDSFSVKSFLLTNGKTSVKFEGSAIKNKGQNFNFFVKNLSSSTAAKYFADIEDEQIKGELNLQGKIRGDNLNPTANVFVEVDSVGYAGNFFGNLFTNFNFKDNLLKTDVKFRKFKNEGENILLTLQGVIPVNLTGVENATSGEKELNLKIHSNEFQVASLNGLLPYVSDLKGALNVDVLVSGKLSDLRYKGNIELKKCNFRSELNNLAYNFGARLKLNGKRVSVEKLFLENKDANPYKGKIEGKGDFLLAGFKPENLNFRFGGSLQTLSESSKSVSPNFFGDLFVKTDGNIRLSMVNEKLKLIGKVKVEDANLKIVPSGSGNLTPQGKIIYDIINADSNKINLTEKKYREYLALIKGREKFEKATKVPFDYDIKIDFDKISRMEIVLSKIWNQKLIVLMKGSLDYLSENGNAHTQGSLELQPGSKLEFIKTFDATGNIKFETDPANPYLDIVAKYFGNYNAGTATAANYIDVEVEMKLKGPLNKLGTNLMKNPQNISIYKGANNIKNRIRDEKYDISDAILFIYLGRFKEDLTAQDKSKLAGIGNTATSFLGSTISSILNSVVGDVVSDIKIDEHGADTRITIAGRYQNIRYTLSGTTRIQNINEANIKVEYQIFPNFILRLERKDPVVRTFGLEEKISELGLKYKVEF